MLLFIIVLVCIGCANGEVGVGAKDSPYGTYKTRIFGIEQTVKFKDKTLEVYNAAEGKRIFEYWILESRGRIQLKNVATGKSHTESYKYTPEHQCVEISDIVYCK